MLTTGPRVISNAVVRSKGDKATYVGHEISRCKDFSSLHYRLPFEKVHTSYSLRFLGFISSSETRTEGVPGLPSRLGRAEGHLGRSLLVRSPVCQ